MTEQVKEKLKKVYALVERGATEGEREAARVQLEKLMNRYNLTEELIQSIDEEYYYFTYTSWNEVRLLQQIAKVLLSLDVTWYKYTDCKRMVARMTYLQKIELLCAYEYFRRHMKQEWNKACADIIKRCRTTKTRNSKRKLLQMSFISQYLYASGLYVESDVTKVSTGELSKERRDALNACRGVQGGAYNKQVSNGLYLES